MALIRGKTFVKFTYIKKYKIVTKRIFRCFRDDAVWGNLAGQIECFLVVLVTAGYAMVTTTMQILTAFFFSRENQKSVRAIFEFFHGRKKLLLRTLFSSFSRAV